MEKLVTLPKERFAALFGRLGAVESSQDYYNDLNQRYSDQARAYHNCWHIIQGFSDFDLVMSLDSDQVDNPDCLELAWFYHDAEYNPASNTNEKDSATLLGKVARVTRLNPKSVSRAMGLILATKHDKPPISPNAKVIVDIDLAILGKPQPLYDQYEIQIRGEYVPNYYDEPTFNRGRLHVLEGFLSRGSIYSTSFFRSLYENQARNNIQRAIRNLKL